MFGQVWVLCALSFVAGSAVTWLVFARTPRRPPPPPPPPVTPMARWAPEPAAEHPSPPPPVPPAAVEPALANLDTHRDDVRRRHPGSVAAGALDRWGIAGAPPPRAADGPEIPRQAGPVDDPAPDDRR